MSRLPISFEQSKPGLIGHFKSFNPNNLNPNVQPANGAQLSSWSTLISNKAYTTVTQATSTNKPTYDVSASLGNKPGINFDLSNSQYLQGTASYLPSSFTTFFVTKPASLSGAEFAFYKGDPTGNGYGYIVYLGNHCILFGGVAIHTGATALTSPSIVVFAWDHLTSTLNFRLNGVTQINSVITAFTTPSPLTLSVGSNFIGTENFNGLIYQITEYDNYFSTPDIVSMERYLAGQYGVSV